MKIFLKEILKEKNISVNQLHTMTKISRTTLDPLTKNEVLPLKTRIETLVRISEALKIPISSLISLDSDYENTKFETEIFTLKNDYNYLADSVHRLLCISVKNSDEKKYSLFTFITYDFSFTDNKVKNEIRLLYKEKEKFKKGSSNFIELDNKIKLLEEEFDLQLKKYKFHEKLKSKIHISDFRKEFRNQYTNDENLSFFEQIIEQSTPLEYIISDDDFILYVSNELSKFLDLTSSNLYNDSLFEKDQKDNEFVDFLFHAYNGNLSKTVSNKIYFP